MRLIVAANSAPRWQTEQHYTAIGTRVLLWLFHYLLDTVYEPSFDSSFAAGWAGYETLNQAYARRLAEIVSQSISATGNRQA